LRKEEERQTKRKIISILAALALGPGYEPGAPAAGANQALTVREYKLAVMRIFNEVHETTRDMDVRNVPELTAKVIPLWEEMKNLPPPESLRENHEKLTGGINAFLEIMHLQTELYRWSLDPAWAGKPENLEKMEVTQKELERLTPQLNLMREAIQRIQEIKDS